MPSKIETQHALKSYLHEWGVAEPLVIGAITFDETSDRFVPDPKKLDAIIQADYGKNLGKAIDFFNALGLRYKADVQDGQVYQDKNWSAKNPTYLIFVLDRLLPLLRFTPSAHQPRRSDEPESSKQVRRILCQNIGFLDNLMSGHVDLARKTITLLLDNVQEEGVFSDSNDAMATLGQMPKTIIASEMSSDVVKVFLNLLKTAKFPDWQIAVLSSLGNLGGVIQKSGLAKEVISFLIDEVLRGELVGMDPDLNRRKFSVTLQTLFKLKPLVIQTGNKDHLLGVLYKTYYDRSLTSRETTLVLLMSRIFEAELKESNKSEIRLSKLFDTILGEGSNFKNPEIKSGRKNDVSDDSMVSTWIDAIGKFEWAEWQGKASWNYRDHIGSIIDDMASQADDIIEWGKEAEVIYVLLSQIEANHFLEKAARTIATLFTKMAAKAHPPLPIEPNPQVANLAIGAALMAHGKETLESLQDVLQGTPDGEIAPQLRKGLETLVAGSGDQIVPDVESIDSTVEVEDEVALAERNDPAWLTAAAFMQMVPIAPVGVGVPLISN